MNTADGFGVFIGKWRGADEFTGWIDEVRIASTNRTAAWYAAEHSNQNTRLVYIVGAETVTPTVATTWKLEDASNTLNFNNLTFGENLNTNNP